MSTVRIKSMSKWFGAPAEPVYAVRDIDMSVAEGEFFTLLGPSGCGKTTTLRCIAGLEHPSSGEVWVGGRQVFSTVDAITVPARKRNASMVFQSYAIWPHMTVGENVAIPLEAAKVPRRDREQRIREALGKVGLAELIGRPANQLSGGQQQRVALARAIVRDAPVLLLDEPLSNLDAELRIGMRAELVELQRSLGVTAVYVTHDQEEALSLSDRVMLMQEGRVVEVGTPEDLYLHPRYRYTAQFIGQGDAWPCSVAVSARGRTCLNVQRLGGLVAEIGPQETAGGARYAVVRPEHVRLVEEGESTDMLCRENVRKGVVRSAAFSGRTREYTVECSGLTVRLHTLSSRRCRPGDRVHVYFPPEHTVIVSDHEEASDAGA